MHVVSGIIEATLLISIQYLTFKYVFPLFICLSILIIVIYRHFHFRIGYEETNMKGFIYDHTCPQSVRFISNLRVPIPKQNQVLIKIKCASLNPGDYIVITSIIPFIRWLFPHTVGRDFSGQIIQIGQGVTSFKVNDEVFGSAIGGSFQEYTVADVNQIALKPEQMSWELAAGLTTAGGTSLQSLNFAGVQKNSNVLIIGASGGTGKFGVLIAKHYGARVVAICSAKNTENVKQLGADRVLNYDNPEYMKEMSQEKFDTIYETVLPAENPNQNRILMQYLKESGKFVAINGNPLALFKTIFNISSGRHYLHLFKCNKNDVEILAQIMKDFKNEKLLFDSVFNLTQKEVEQAFEIQKSLHSKGKIIIKIEKEF